MKRIAILPVLLVAGCASSLSAENGQCRPESVMPSSSGNANSESMCDIRIEDSAKSKDAGK